MRKILFPGNAQFCYETLRLVDAIDQVAEPLATEITCLRRHEPRLFHLVSADVGSPRRETTV